MLSSALLIGCSPRPTSPPPSNAVVGHGRRKGRLGSVRLRLAPLRPPARMFQAGEPASNIFDCRRRDYAARLRSHARCVNNAKPVLKETDQQCLLMARSLELMIGAGMLAAGLTGLIYAMPLISSSVSAKTSYSASPMSLQPTAPLLPTLQ